MNSLQLRDCLLCIGSQNSSSSQKELSWKQLYSDPGFRAWLHQIALKFARGNYHTAQDLQQEAWLALLQAMPTFEAVKEPFPGERRSF